MRGEHAEIWAKARARLTAAEEREAEERYEDTLQDERDRIRARRQAEQEAAQRDEEIRQADAREFRKAHPPGPRVLWYGEVPPEPPPYLIKGCLPQTMTAIAAGTFGSGKTFVLVDLVVSVMTGFPFAGMEVVRPGACLWLAAEGENEIEIRVKAAFETRIPDETERPTALPFARQAGSVPKLTDPEAGRQLLEILHEFRTGLAARNPGTELAIVVIDTLNSAADFVDQNSGAEAQRVFDLLREMSRATGALFLVVDHFGKLAETGVKGSQNKSDSADAILAVLSDIDAAGAHTNRRLVQRKLRNGPSGHVIAQFKLPQVAVDDWGNTTCVVDWLPESTAATQPRPSSDEPQWTVGMRTFKASMVHAMIDHAVKTRPFGSQGREIRAVALHRVKEEFHARYPAESQEAKQTQFRRNLKDATGRGLIASRELDGVDWLWFIRDADEPDSTKTKTTP